jgi:hypothetical protein
MLLSMILPEKNSGFTIIFHDNSLNLCVVVSAREQISPEKSVDSSKENAYFQNSFKVTLLWRRSAGRFHCSV